MCSALALVAPEAWKSSRLAQCMITVMIYSVLVAHNANSTPCDREGGMTEVEIFERSSGKAFVFDSQWWEDEKVILAALRDSFKHNIHTEKTKTCRGVWLKSDLRQLSKHIYVRFSLTPVHSSDVRLSMKTLVLLQLCFVMLLVLPPSEVAGAPLDISVGSILSPVTPPCPKCYEENNGQCYFQYFNLLNCWFRPGITLDMGSSSFVIWDSSVLQVIKCVQIQEASFLYTTPASLVWSLLRVQAQIFQMDKMFMYFI